MKFFSKILSRISLSALLLSPIPALAAPDYYPKDYDQIVKAAEKEGGLTIYGTNGMSEMKPFIDAFNMLYPSIKVDYGELSSVVLYNRLLSEAVAGSTADLTFTSSVNLHMKLAMDGFALEYASPEIAKIQTEGVWQNKLYNLENEPVCNIYNKKLIASDAVPKTRADFVKMLADPKLKGKVMTYDIERSGVAYLINYIDSKTIPDFLRIPSALGAASVQLAPGAFIMSEKVGSGEAALAYNVPCQVMVKASTNPNIGNFFFQDGTQMTAPTAFITKVAKNPNAAKVFLDFLLSEPGQQLFAQMPGVYPVRIGMVGPGARAVGDAGSSLKPLKLDASLLETLDPATREQFLRQWKAALAGNAAK